MNFKRPIISDKGLPSRPELIISVFKKLAMPGSSLSNTPSSDTVNVLDRFWRDRVKSLISSPILNSNSLPCLLAHFPESLRRFHFFPNIFPIPVSVITLFGYKGPKSLSCFAF